MRRSLSCPERYAMGSQGPDEPHRDPALSQEYPSAIAANSPHQAIASTLLDVLFQEPASGMLSAAGSRHQMGFDALAWASSRPYAVVVLPDFEWLYGTISCRPKATFDLLVRQSLG